MNEYSHRELVADAGGMRTAGGYRRHTAAIVNMASHARWIAAELQGEMWAASCPLLSIFPLTATAQEGIAPLAYKLQENRRTWEGAVLFTVSPQHLKTVPGIWQVLDK